MNVTIELTGTAEIDKLFAKIIKRAKNMQPVMSEVGNYLQNTIEESFDGEHAPDGEAWTPLASSTLIQKNKKGSKRMLYDDGTLFESIGYEATSHDLTIGVNAYSDSRYPYPIVHQFGSVDGKIPARAFMPINGDGELYGNVKEELIDLLKDFLAEGLK